LPPAIRRSASRRSRSAWRRVRTSDWPKATRRKVTASSSVSFAVRIMWAMCLRLIKASSIAVAFNEKSPARPLTRDGAGPGRSALPPPVHPWSAGNGTAIRRSADGPEIVGGQLAVALVRHEIELDLLAFDQMTEASALDGAYMDECVLAAVVGLDEAEALLRVKPLHGSRRHEENPFTS